MKQLLLVLIASIPSSLCFAEPEGAPAFPKIGKVYVVTWVAADAKGKPLVIKPTKFLGGTWYSAEVFNDKEPRTVVPLNINFAHVCTANEILAGVPPLTAK